VHRVDGEDADPTEWVDPTDRGQVLHWICEHLRAPEQIPPLIEQALQVYRLAGTPQGDALASAAKEMLERYVASPLFTRLQQADLQAEVPFTLEVGGLRLEGRIDALGKDSAGKAMLVDYKTNRVSELDVPTQAKAYELQMGVYALAARDLGYEVKEATLLFLEPGVAHSVPIDFVAVEATIAGLAERIRTGSTDIGDYPQDLSHCHKCRFRSICGT
jgi:ATP-dependent exoDNAse (exonuclease V) beta subunit